MKKAQTKKKGWGAWGIGIVTVVTLFVSGVLFMVSNAMRQKIDLVAPDYYAREIAYQEQIDKISRSQALEEAVSVITESGNIVIDFPFAGNKLSGEVEVFKPSDAASDCSFKIEADSSGLMLIPTAQFSPGVYKVKIDWTHDSLSYYDEQVLNLNKQ